ncbi:MAG: AMP-binding protein, partial [Anaerolineales bacterium]|nr:AMP-binding protein [Anaerolineales bacterium]
MKDYPWYKKYDKGVPHTIEYPAVPLFYFLEENARKFPDKACTIFKGAIVTFREMNEITDRVAGALAKMGIKKGDRVGLFMPNTPQ